MLLGIDHVVVAVPDPDAAVTELGEAIGTEPGGGGRHDGLGTFNRLLWLGDSFIELIGIYDRALAAASWIGAPTVQAMDDGGGLATLAIATDDIAGDVERLRAAGSDLSEPGLGQRVRPDGQVVRWWLATPRRLGASDPPFLIEHDATAAEWTPADRAARAAGRGRLQGVDLPVPDVASTAQPFARTVGVEFRSETSSRSCETWIGRQFLRLHEGDQPRRASISLSFEGRDASRVELLGCIWNINQ